MPKSLRTSSSKSKFAAWNGDEDAVDCNIVGGVQIVVTPTDDFRLMRIALAFSALILPNIIITQDNLAGAAWDQVLVDYTPLVNIQDFSFYGGICYEYLRGNAILIDITQVVALVNVSWKMEQI